MPCAAASVWEARSGASARWRNLRRGERLLPGFAWVSAGILVNAALITTLGFILSCALCFVLAVRGFKPRRPADRSPASVAGRRADRLRHRRAGVLDVHATARHQPAQLTTGWLWRKAAPGKDILNQEQLLQGFATAATPINLLWALLGCTIGTAVGVLPGIGPGHRGGDAAADHAQGRPDRRR